MTSLKQEMRQRYEKHSSMAFYEDNSSFEEGLLEKIMNYAFANLSPYSSKRWNITAVKSPVLLQKLYKATNERRIAECAIALIVCGCSGQASEYVQERGIPRKNDTEYRDLQEYHLQDLELLALSVSYAAKYYCIDCITIKTFDREPVSREFALDRKQPAAAILCLGFFKDEAFSTPSVKNFYSNTVRII